MLPALQNLPSTLKFFCSIFLIEIFFRSSQMSLFSRRFLKISRFPWHNLNFLTFSWGHPDSWAVGGKLVEDNLVKRKLVKENWSKYYWRVGKLVNRKTGERKTDRKKKNWRIGKPVKWKLVKENWSNENWWKRYEWKRIGCLNPSLKICSIHTKMRWLDPKPELKNIVYTPKHGVAGP